MIADIRRRYRQLAAKLMFNRQVPVLRIADLRRRIEHSAREREKKLIRAELARQDVRTREWIAAGEAQIGIVEVRRIGNIQVQIGRLCRVGALIQQALGKTIEDTVPAANDGLVVAEDVKREADARREVLPIVVEDRRGNALVP